MYQETFETPFGALTVRATETGVTNLCRGSGEDRPNRWTNLTVQQLREYLAGSRTAFDLPLEPAGTPFQRRVWEELVQIPFGATITYGELARRVDCRSPRAVGQAVGRNPILILIPCHRVLAANGRLGGFSSGLPVKEFLLNLEKIPFLYGDFFPLQIGQTML